MDARSITAAGLPFLLVPLLAACAGDAPTDPHRELARSVSDAVAVDDLSASDATPTTLDLAWTQVGDGSGKPAWYEVRYDPAPVESWDGASPVTDGACADPVKGDAIGSGISCTVEGLEAGTSYDFRLVSFRRGGRFRPETSTPSNVATGRTAPAEDDEPADTVPTDTTSADTTANEAPVAEFAATCTDLACEFDGSGSYDPDGGIAGYAWSFGDGAAGDGERVRHEYETDGTYEATLIVRDEGAATDTAAMSVTVEEPVVEEPSGSGIWIGPAELAALPTSGSAWENVKAEADGSCGAVDLSDQDQDNNVCIMAKALVHARTGEAGYRSDVVAALQQIVEMGTYDGRALALGRELAAYVLAADLIDLESHDPSLDGDFRSKLRELLTTPTSSGPDDLVECHEDRPNNWGTHCGASRAAVAAYLGDTAELDRVARVFRGWLGDRSSYAGFRYGDLSWQCDADRPVGINPAGCTRDGHSIDGVLPDDQRRGGDFTWPPPRENYVWEALQGALVQAVILHRAGYAAFEWEDRALHRAVRWLHEEAEYPAEGDDTWQPHVVNRYYGTSFPAPEPSRAGKNVGWTDWTHP